jgi:serine/threonine-protein kinase
VWALGSTLYLLLTDQLPYGDVNASNARDANHFQQPFIPASRLNIQVGAALDRILSRALTVEPRRRYANAKEMLADLEKWRPDTGAAGKLAYTTNSSGLSKTALGSQTPPDSGLAQEMSGQALQLARQAGHLKEAADLMEEAFNKWPALRERYEYRLTLWRRGVSG